MASCSTAWPVVHCWRRGFFGKREVAFGKKGRNVPEQQLINSGVRSARSAGDIPSMPNLQPLLVPCKGVLGDLHAYPDPADSRRLLIWWGTALMQAVA